MQRGSLHSFHIPVMGLGFTIDTPLKVAKYGITSVVSIMEDHLIEAVRKVYCERYQITYRPIETKEDDYRAKRITAYLNLLQDIIKKQMDQLREMKFGLLTELDHFFELLPKNSFLANLYGRMILTEDPTTRDTLQVALKKQLVPGKVEVNIMTKLDKTNYDKNGKDLGPGSSDALSALRGFCNVKGEMSVVFSAGMNPRLYTYCEEFEGFFPDASGMLHKKVILKVSDYRSALIQGKIFAKKGIWISEYRIESGLNCGGHAFATQGMLLGPILDEFKNQRKELYEVLLKECTEALTRKGKFNFQSKPVLKITAQGGIGTCEEHEFLIENYSLDGTGWGSPFLLVPEATSVDQVTMNALINANEQDFYLSDSSPLGVKFNNFRNTSSNEQREKRIAAGKPGSPCYKGFLSNNTELTDRPICTASRQYQVLKKASILAADLSKEEQSRQLKKMEEKECLCEGLGTTVRLVTGAPLSHKLKAVSICPGPNLSYFGKIYSLSEMVDHIYGKTHLTFKRYRPNLFINEAKLYVDYLNREIQSNVDELSPKQIHYYENFRLNLENGLKYYKNLAQKFFNGSGSQFVRFNNQLDELLVELSQITILVAETK